MRVMCSDCGYDPDRLALRLGVSRRHLQRLFLKVVQCPPRTWLREAKLQAAHRLLVQSKSVKEVALTLQFSTASQFSRDFRLRFGYAPADLVRGANRSRRVAVPKVTRYLPAA